jgi:hypothetical protein
MIMKDAMAEMMKALGLNADDQSMGVMGMYFGAEILRAMLVAVGVTQKPVAGGGAFMVGGLIGAFACAWFGISFLMMPSYTPALFWSDVFVGGFLFCGIAGWIIGFFNSKMK